MWTVRQYVIRVKQYLYTCMLIACNEQTKPVWSLFWAPSAWVCVLVRLYIKHHTGLVNMARDVNAAKYEDWIWISYLDIQGFSKITEHVNWKNELEDLCLIAVGYTCIFFLHVRIFNHIGWGGLVVPNREYAVRRSLLFDVEMRIWTFSKGLNKPLMHREVVDWQQARKLFQVFL